MAKKPKKKSTPKASKDKPKKNVQMATWLKNVEPGYARDKSHGAILLENIDGAKFGALLSPENAQALLVTAMDLCKAMPPIRPDPKKPSHYAWVTSNAETFAIVPGRSDSEINVQIGAEGLRVSFWVDLDMFLESVAPLIRHLQEREKPETIQ